MADSGITKRALAAAMKNLMQKTPFTKISVGDICSVCDMNRKSFYYHFKDKYDLVNWIFDTEFLAMVQKRGYDSVWVFFLEMCSYFYENITFYRRALQVEGQNSFAGHFNEVLSHIIRTSLSDTFQDPETSAFFTAFFADAFCAAIIRWLTDASPMPPERFVRLLQDALTGAVRRAQGVQ